MIARAVVVAVVALAAVIVLATRDADGGKAIYRGEGARVFTLLYDGAAVRVARPEPGALVTLAGERKGLTAALSVRPLRLPPYRGQPAGVLPLYADDYVRRAEPGADVTVDTRARLAGAPGYELGLDLGGGRTATLIFLVPEDEPGTRDGVLLRFDELRPPGLDRGGGRRVSLAMRSALRSFAFGTERD